MARTEERNSRILAPDQNALAVKRSKNASELIFSGCNNTGISVRYRGGSEVFRNSKPTEVSIILNHPGVLRQMFFPFPTELELGEAYIREDFSVEGDIEDDLVKCISLGEPIKSVFKNPSLAATIAYNLFRLPRTEKVQVPGSARVQGKVHSEERDKQAISHHYDQQPEFYEQFLDDSEDPKKRTMQYSCAYFTSEDIPLSDAQAAKLEHISRKLQLNPGERLLDIGCGWGGLISYAASRYGVDATGITLSTEQADFGNQRIQEAGLADHCRIEICDYREKTGEFDKIVSVGMVEHVGKKNLPEYFSQAFKLLKPQGSFLCHGIANNELQDQSPSSVLGRKVADLAQRVLGELFNVRMGSFIQEYVFPDGELVTTGESLSAAEKAGFEIRDVENLREHYAMTLRHWVNNLRDHKEEIIALVGVPTYRVWELYMSGCVHAFNINKLGLYQTLLVKPDGNGRSDSPLTREHLYRAA